MDENMNGEMSVDELLEKLKASLQSDETKEETSPEKVEDDEIKKAVASAIGEVEEPAPAPILVVEEGKEEAAQEPTEVVEEAEAEEEIFEPEEAEPEEAEPVEEPKDEASPINDDDIFAAWGIDRTQLSADEPIMPAEEVDAPEEDFIETSSEPSVSTPTKVYYIARIESKETFAARKESESQEESAEYDSVDYSLIKQALGMEKAIDAEEQPQEFEVEEENEPKTIDAPQAEFTYQRQQEDFRRDYVTASRKSCIKLIFTAVFTLLLFALECLPTFGVSLPAYFDSNLYPVVYSMATLQLVWLCGAMSYKEIANGFLSLLRFRFTSGSLLGISVLMCTVCSAVCTALGSTVTIYHFSAAFLALIIRVFDFLDMRREILTFDVVSSVQSQKYVAMGASIESVAQIEGLEDYTGEDSLVLRTEKCNFVENYFARTSKRTGKDIVGNKYIVPILFAVAIVSFVLTAVSGDGITIAFSAFNMTFAIGLPALALFSSSYPLYKSAKKLFDSESAIVGESAVDEYSGTTMICFDDIDAFPSYGVGIESLRIYGNSDIETIIEQMGAVFSKVGGPLRNVFVHMTSDCPKPYKVKIEGVFDSGIKAIVDGKTLFIGNADYIKQCGFNVLDVSDRINGKRCSTMYLADDKGLRAKFFIRYTLDGSFESIVKKLARHGIASVILTGDSNISDQLLAESMDISRLPVKVVRRSGTENVNGCERADSGVVSCGGVGNLVDAVTMCDRLAKVIATMGAVRITSAVICAVLATVLAVLNMTDSIPSLYVFVYHLFWLIPSWLVTKFNL